MEPKRRIRIFAGPNGSGKTTIIEELRNKIKFSYYINADDIENQLRQSKKLSLLQFGIEIGDQAIQDFFKKSTFAPVILNAPDLWNYFHVNNNELKIDETLVMNSYIAADIAEFIRTTLLANGKSFTFETVMSHPDKLRFLKKAKDQGYRIYLYFIATDDPSININRVNIRVAQDGHKVNPNTIIKRYYKSLENLKEAVMLSNRAYLFDNSGEVSRLLAEITEGKEVKIIDTNSISNWFMKYLLDK